MDLCYNVKKLKIKAVIVMMMMLMLMMMMMMMMASIVRSIERSIVRPNVPL